MIGSPLDTILDRTVVVGYTNIGYRIRSRGWDASDLGPMLGKVVLVTGASSGLGLAAAEGFAHLGATVWLVVRSRERGEQARAGIVERTGNSDVHVGLCDLSELALVRQLAGRVRDQASRLDVLVNNAGVMTERRGVSADGIELTLATNVIGPFLLTNLLIALLVESAPARIINVSSGGMYTQKVAVDDLQSERGEFDGPKVYARTKRAEVILTEIWAEQLAGTGVVVHSMHPGWSDTRGVRSSLPRFYELTRPLLRTPAEGADTIVWLGAAAEPGRSSGRFWHDRRPRPTHWLPWTRETRQERERLLAECARLSGWRDPSAPTASISNAGRRS
jgi:dehydrogenase/reductase SDR family protein 12